MEEENEAIIIAMVIGAVILGIGLAMFFNRPFTGYGAVVLAIGLMTLSLIITMRAEEIIHLKIIPTASRSENIDKVSVETPPPTEPTPIPSAETQPQESLDTREPYEVQIEQTPEAQEVEDTQQVQEALETQQQQETHEPWQTQETPEAEKTQQVQEVEETEQTYTPSMYEPSPPHEADTTTAQETEEYQESTTTVETTN